MRDQVRSWLEALGHAVEDRSDPANEGTWKLAIVLAPGKLDVVVQSGDHEPEVVVEAFDWLKLESLATRQGPDAAHRVRAAIQKRDSRDVELELHRNGKVWLRSRIARPELDAAILAQRLKRVQDEHRAIHDWVDAATRTGALPR